MTATLEETVVIYRWFLVLFLLFSICSCSGNMVQSSRAIDRDRRIEQLELYIQENDLPTPAFRIDIKL